jgi:hypothetical protein
MNIPSLVVTIKGSWIWKEWCERVNAYKHQKYMTRKGCFRGDSFFSRKIAMIVLLTLVDHAYS